MGAAASIAMAGAAVAMPLPAAGIFAAGVAVGAAWGLMPSDVVYDGLNSVDEAVDAVTAYLRTAASSAFDKLKAAAAFVKDKVIKLVRHLVGDMGAAAARREVDRAAAAAEDAGHDDVLSRASARVDGLSRALPPSSAIVSATAPGGALALQGSTAGLATRAARRASEMMALLKDAFRALGDRITRAAKFCISGVVAAVGSFEAIGAVAARVA